MHIPCQEHLEYCGLGLGVATAPAWASARFASPTIPTPHPQSCTRSVEVARGSDGNKSGALPELKNGAGVPCGELQDSSAALSQQAITGIGSALARRCGGRDHEE